MKLIKLVVFGVIAAFVLVSVSAYAQTYTTTTLAEKWKTFKSKMAQKKEAIIEELNLTPEQKNKLDKLRTESRDQMMVARQTLGEARRELVDALSKYESDSKAIQDIVSRIKVIQDNMVDQRVKNILEIRSVLNKEQFEKFMERTKEVFKEWRDKKTSSIGVERGSHEQASVE